MDFNPIETPEARMAACRELPPPLAALADYTISLLELITNDSGPDETKTESLIRLANVLEEMPTREDLREGLDAFAERLESVVSRFESASESIAQALAVLRK